MSVIRQTITRSLRASTFKRFPSTISSIRFNSSTAAAESSAPVDPKITQIVDQISTLTLLETSQLVNELKSKLNISDIALPVAGGAGAGGAAQQAAPAEEEEAKQPVEEKTMFAIKLESFDAKSKPKVIKEVKGLLGLSLVESKKFVESAPKVLKENVAKEDAEKIKATLEGLGAKVVLE
ncbi:MNP1 [Candida margitis]|uniref:MNP1 n=1 Tax=Candida margitis TaxID=1775924 RepID=UPI002226C219|nr:MNP1 [Candida margitis]KAI5950532.1 MNP1 [Candida margitis]